jgi:hypothetical protein
MLGYQAYRASFNAARIATNQAFAPNFRVDLVLPEKPPQPYDGDRIVAGIFNLFKEQGAQLSPGYLAQKCFLMAAVASTALTQARIPHVMTIGDVRHPQNASPAWGYGVTQESLEADIEAGDKAGDGKAHAWITLNSGQVLDITEFSSGVVATQPSAAGRPITRPSALREVTVFSDHTDPSVFEYKPMLLGMGYHFSAVTSARTDPMFYPLYRECHSLYEATFGAP